MWYYRRLADGVVVMQTRPEHAEQLEQLQRDCFPTLDDAQRFKAAHYRRHIELFPDGQFVALDGDKVVGATTTLRLPFDFHHINHTFADIIEGGWLTSHQPASCPIDGRTLSAGSPRHELPSRTRWYDYSRARDQMLAKTDTRVAPWYLVRSDDKRTARLNTIEHILSLLPYKKVPRKKVKLPKRSTKGAYDDEKSIARRRWVPERY